MNIRIECPLGSKCEKRIDDNTIERCAWYIKVVGKNPQSEETFNDWGCAMGWLPVLLIENAQTNRGQTAAIENMRNDMVVGQNTFNSLLARAQGLIPIGDNNANSTRIESNTGSKKG